MHINNYMRYTHKVMLNIYASSSIFIHYTYAIDDFSKQNETDTYSLLLKKWAWKNVHLKWASKKKHHLFQSGFFLPLIYSVLFFCHYILGPNGGASVGCGAKGTHIREKEILLI